MDRMLCNVYVVNLISELNLRLSDLIKHCLHAIQLLLSFGSYNATLGFRLLLVKVSVRLI